LAPDVVLANVPYVTLLAAQRAGIPAAGFCSLNWYDILAGYCADRTDARPMLDAIASAYRAATVFLCPTPSLPMPWHPRVQTVGPVARTPAPVARPAALPAHADGGPAIVLLSLGGIRSDLGLAAVPRVEGVHWIVAIDQIDARRDDVTRLDELGVGLLDVLPFADAVVAKTGYGTFVEAACNGVRVLYAERPDWPEAPALESWLSEHATAAAISQDALYDGTYADALMALLARPRSQVVAATGAQEVAHTLTELAR
ncbi:MAG: hypothetical protein AAGD86_12705, partial [Pseudomonadota bacterium]